ncbi:MAG: cation-translocating P-type ATPase [Cardiobacteriaceae bacterium]|nr:cation-translocating P-type ATPase [Cardiobacteriaceae bacterium]
MRALDSCHHCHGRIIEGTALTVELEGKALWFCSPACRDARLLVEESKLSQYYAMRDEKTIPQESALSKAHKPQTHWQAYDIPEIKEQYVYQSALGNEIHLYIEGIHCGACSWLITSSLKEKLGLEQVFVNATTSRAEIHFPHEIKLSQILELIAKLGFVPNVFTPEQNEVRQTQQRSQHLMRLIVAGLGMMQVMMFATGLYTGAFHGIAAEYLELLRWVSLFFTTPVFFYSGFPFLRGAWFSLKARKVNMDLPIAFALASTYFASVWNTFIGHGEIYFESVTMFIFFMTVSRFFEFLTRRRAQLNEIQFAKLLPEAVEKYVGTKRFLTPLAAIQVGDVVRILPSQTIAIDGEIVRGETRVDEAMLTGESKALCKTIGDKVLAGSHNLHSPIDVRVGANGQMTTLAGIRRLMARAEQHKNIPLMKSRELAEWTIIGVMLLSVVGYVGWQFVEPERSFEIAIAILVATCPCALSLAVPTALTTAINHANRHGVLIKNSETLSRLLSVKHLVFDKTGTLTEGHFRLVRQDLSPDYEAGFLWQLAKSLQIHSSHPIAWAMCEHVALPELALDEVEHKPSQGVVGSYQGKRWAIGRAQCLQEAFPEMLFEPSALAAEETGVWVYLGNDEGVQARFLFDDPPREGIQALFKRLQREGIYRCHIASGDHEQNVAKMAAWCGIDSAKALLSPEDKCLWVQSFDEPSLMMGDGINDAPVMAAATVSVAVGKANPLSQTQADVVLLRKGVEVLPYLLDLAVQTERIIRQNIRWAIGYNVVIIPLAILGFLTPWLAALGMSMSSLLVVGNALRLGRLAKPEDYGG